MLTKSWVITVLPLIMGLIFTGYTFVTGNPVTDVILTTKYKEAEEKGIELNCKFAYPLDTRINAFDISVILNNAIENAFEGVRECKNPTVSVISYRKKNAYMIEVVNNIITEKT